MSEIPLTIIWNLGIALLLGLIVGIEREFQHYKQHIQIFAGIRTFTLIALFGWLIGFLTQQLGEFTLVLVGISGMVILSMVTYVVMVWKKNLIGITNEISALIVFLLGILVSYNFILIALISAVVMTTILSYKYYLHKIAQKLQVEEIHAGLKLGIISVVVLPLLPDKSYSLIDIPYTENLFQMFPKFFYFLQHAQIFNPFKIWLLVVFICALSSIGYLLIKTIGPKKGIGITGAIGGIVSSTAVTSTFSTLSKKVKTYNTFAFGVIIAWTVMLIRTLFIILILNKTLFSSVFNVISLMIFTAACCATYFYLQRTQKGKKTETSLVLTSPFALIPALKLTLFFVVFLFLSKLLQYWLGSTGIYVACVLAAFTATDATIISVVTLFSAGEISLSVAVTGVILTIMSDAIGKIGITYFFGEKHFARLVAIAAIIILTVAVIGLLIF
ncbi:MAG: DUF4010 domain-containing protein [Candidatus Woesearchaeota archaeon]